MKIVLQSKDLTSYPNFASDIQNEFREANIVLSTPDTLHIDIQDADAVYGVPDPDVLAEAKRLKWIACPAIGVNFLMNRPDIINSDAVLDRLKEFLPDFVVVKGRSEPTKILEVVCRRTDATAAENAAADADGGGADRDLSSVLRDRGRHPPFAQRRAVQVGKLADRLACFTCQRQGRHEENP